MDLAEQELRHRLASIIEGRCPHCGRELVRESFPKHVDHGVCESCAVGFIAQACGDSARWQESALWWLRGEVPPPIDPDAIVHDLNIMTDEP